MFREEKNLKDLSSNSDITIKDTPISISYTKTNKLITALYMVTDIIDKDEPLRNKLRTLGTEIISDMNFSPSDACRRIAEIMSFLDIASAVYVISEMNCNILRKEFLELNRSIEESTGRVKGINRQINLVDFLREELPLTNDVSFNKSDKKFNSIGHHQSTSIGVQKGNTLMKALSGIKVSSRPIDGYDRKIKHIATESFDILKKQRRNEITNLIQKNGGNATITDIKNGAYGSLSSCGEKTLQRELVSMVKDGVLNKTGEKRWSRYFIK
ncbi:MAG: hypothetical protein WC870_00320 [Candidatus Paceibacterota bacterium]